MASSGIYETAEIFKSRIAKNGRVGSIRAHTSVFIFSLNSGQPERAKTGEVIAREREATRHGEPFFVHTARYRRMLGLE